MDNIIFQNNIKSQIVSLFEHGSLFQQYVLMEHRLMVPYYKLG